MENCPHYRTGCRIFAECCRQFFLCRLCHNETEDHEIDRYAIQKIQCKKCKHIQEKSNHCADCQERFADHYCNKCNVWCADPIYHCDKCNICYKSSAEERHHCDHCNLCFYPDAKNHTCPKYLRKETMMNEECPLCFEKLYYTPRSPSFLNCGHCIHSKCLEEMLNHGHVSCPICKRLMVDVNWEFLDRLIAENPYDSDRQVDILCNDCLAKSTMGFHPYGHKCIACKSYNTTVVS